MFGFVIKCRVDNQVVTQSHPARNHLLEGLYEAGGVILAATITTLICMPALLMRIKGNTTGGTRNTILAIDHFWAAQVNSIAVKRLSPLPVR